MTVTPSSSDPETPQPQRRLLGLRFWMFMAFTILCVAAGAAITVYAPKLLPKTQNHGRPFNGDTAKRLIEGSETLGSAMSPTVPAGPEHAQIADTARQALTAAQLLQSGRTTRPFRVDWGRLDAMEPGNADVAALRDLAGIGAPSPTALAHEFPSYAAKAVAATRAAGPGANVWLRLRASLLGMVALRRVDDLTGNSPDAAIARAESKLKDGDVEAALHALETLDSKSRVALEPWLAHARARTEIDRRLVALQDHALLEVNQLNGVNH